jgi:hypothetical protein
MVNHPNRKPRFSTRLAIATYFCRDVAEVEEWHRYQPTRTPCPVYYTGNDYFTAAPIGKNPKGNADWFWTPVEDATVAHYGYQIWQHVEPST